MSSPSLPPGQRSQQREQLDLFRALPGEDGRNIVGRDPQEVVAAHVRRLDALRRAGIVERVAEGLWKVPDDLAERGRQYDALGTLRDRELSQVAKEITAETGLAHRPVMDGQRVVDIYMLASGRYAMLVDGMGFSLVPWRPVIEQRLGQQLAATVRGGGVSWEVGRLRGPSIG